MHQQKEDKNQRLLGNPIRITVILIVALVGCGYVMYEKQPTSTGGLVNAPTYAINRSDMGSEVVLAKYDSYSKIFVPCSNCPFNIYNDEGPVEIIDPEGLTHHDVPGKLLDLGPEKKSGGTWLFRSEVPGKSFRVTMTWRPRQSPF